MTTNLLKGTITGELNPDEVWARVPEPLKLRMAHVFKELDRACQKHPAFPIDAIHQAAILAEEAGEVIKAALQLKYENGRHDELYLEAMQTGAMALRVMLFQPVPDNMRFTTVNEPAIVRELDTQHIDEPQILSGLYECVEPYTNEMNYTYKPGEQLQVIRHRQQHGVCVCQLPGNEMWFDISDKVILDHFKPVDMLV